MTAQADTTPAGAALFCCECGGELDSPGGPCPNPGWLPSFDVRRRAVSARYGSQVAELREIDRAEHAKELQDKAGQARPLVAPVRARSKTLEVNVTEAIAAERAAEDRVRQAEQFLGQAYRLSGALAAGPPDPRQWGQDLVLPGRSRLSGPPR
jgi:hypothetical protein